MDRDIDVISPSVALIGQIVDFAPRRVVRYDYVLCEYCGREQKFPDNGECCGCGAPLSVRRNAL